MTAHRSPADDFAEAADYLTRRVEAGATLPPEDARRVATPRGGTCDGPPCTCGALASPFAPPVQKRNRRR